MHIEKIVISNFKGLRNADFTPTGFACLVGENNAGKSTVLQSIVYALNRPTSLPLELFYDRSLPVEFNISFKGITAAHLARLAEEHRAKIEELVVDGLLDLTVRYNPGQKVDVKVGRLKPIDPRYQDDQISSALSGRRGAAIRQAVIEQYPEFADDCPSEINMAGAKQYLSECMRRLPREQLTLVESPLPSGITSSITTLLPEPIYIPAVKNLADDLKTSQTTSFGRLLGLLLEDMTPDLTAINESLAELNGLFNRVEVDGEVVDGRHACVKDLERSVEGFLRENFPAVKVDLEVPPPDLKTILNTAKIFIDDGSRDLIDNKGDGIKRSLTFALLRCWVARMNSAQSHNGEEQPARRPMIFLFEEPELYLHPKSQRILFSTLAKIADNYQVVVTTHSPMFFEPGVTASFVRVAKKQTEPKPIGCLHPVVFALDPDNAETFRLARFENADAAFFSQRVVLFEGESDDAFFKHVAKHLDPAWDFDVKNVAMVRVSGKGNFAKFRKFFEAFGIDVKIVADLDAMFEGFAHLGVGGDVNDVKATAIQKIDERIAALGIKAEPAARQIKDKMNGQSFKQRYDDAKSALRRVQEGAAVDEVTVTALDGLFTWEKDIARVRACHQDDEARGALVPVLDRMREQGVCVLLQGAIEDYYPDGAPRSGPKPSRAMVAASLVLDSATASALSLPLAPGRPSELHQICDALFRGL
ncbi:ATP-dependent nuclease [Methylocystis sp. JAN1]|uniref:ATP-dependent nuclease n=1 Tax=Methylocystis sp. JAN1 TaxID=3397211 RepID=UPI003FA2293A